MPIHVQLISFGAVGSFLNCTVLRRLHLNSKYATLPLRSEHRAPGSGVSNHMFLHQIAFPFRCEGFDSNTLAQFSFEGFHKVGEIGGPSDRKHDG